MSLKVIPHELKNVAVFDFPDGQPHVQYTGPKGVAVDVIQPIRNPKDLLVLALTVDALIRGRCHLSTLYIPYLMGARSDREMIAGDSVCLEVMAVGINSLQFARVALLDVHSEVALERIRNSYNIDPIGKLIYLAKPPEVIICPDNGAYNRTQSAHDKFPESKVIRCSKTRNETGRITLTIHERDKEICKNRDCLIVDDLCDAGGTFLAIAEQIEPKSLQLIVTHGIFSKGFEELRKKFEHIITSNSFHDRAGNPAPDNFITVYPYKTLMEI